MSLNKVMLIGNVGRDPEVRYIDSGVATATLTLATTTRGYTTQNGTPVPERTEWHRIVLWRKLAETVEKYVHKGDKLFIEGELRTRSYTDRKGYSHNITEVWASQMEMLTPRASATGAPATQTYQAAPQQPIPQPTQSQAAPSAPQPAVQPLSILPDNSDQGEEESDFPF